MKYWDMLSRFHDSCSKDFPDAVEGMKAFLFLRSFFEQSGCEELHRDHPLRNRLGVGNVLNYQWLTQYARKLLTACSIPGFEQVAKRLSNHREYLAANNEAETALKLHLARMDVSFSKTSSTPSPDLTLRIGNTTLGVEVSSLHPPDEEIRVWMLTDRILRLSFYKDVITGGFVNRVPSLGKIQEIGDKLTNIIDQAKEKKKIEKLNFEGIATIYVAPRDMRNQMPKDCRGMLHGITRQRRPVVEQISKKIETKGRQLFADDKNGLLFLYTNMIDKNELFHLFEHDTVDIVVIMASYPKLVGLILTVPHLGVEVVSTEKLDGLRKEYKDNTTFLESEAGVCQYESSIIWKNIYADNAFPDEVNGALGNYASNLIGLSPLMESFKGFVDGT